MFAFRCKSVRFAKAYINHFVALPNAIYCHSMYWMSKREESNIWKCTGGEKAVGVVETVETWKRFTPN